MGRLAFSISCQGPTNRARLPRFTDTIHAPPTNPVSSSARSDTLNALADKDPAGMGIGGDNPPLPVSVSVSVAATALHCHYRSNSNAPTPIESPGALSIPSASVRARGSSWQHMCTLPLTSTIIPSLGCHCLASTVPVSPHTSRVVAATDRSSASDRHASQRHRRRASSRACSRARSLV